MYLSDSDDRMVRCGTSAALDSITASTEEAKLSVIIEHGEVRKIRCIIKYYFIYPSYPTYWIFWNYAREVIVIHFSKS